MNAKAGNMAKSRLNRKWIAMSKAQQIEDAASVALESLYAGLVSGLDATLSELVEIDDRKEAFKSDMYDLFYKLLRDAGQLSYDELGLSQDFIKNSVTGAFNVKNTNAIDFLSYQALVISEVEGEEITKELISKAQSGLVDFLEKGLTPREFYAQVLDSAGVGKIKRGHLQTVLRTNIATARSASTMYAMNDNAEAFPAWEYVAVKDDRTRDNHARLDGMIFKASDKRLWPPLGFNCRCEASPVHKSELDEEGYKITDSPDIKDDDGNVFSADRGFGSDALTNFQRWSASKESTVPELKKVKKAQTDYTEDKEKKKKAKDKAKKEGKPEPKTDDFDFDAYMEKLRAESAGVKGAPKAKPKAKPKAEPKPKDYTKGLPTDPDDLAEWFDKTDAIERRITKAQVEALTDYKGEEYFDINHYLRGKDVENIEDLKNTKRLIKHMDDAFSKATPLPDDIYVYRGMNSERMEKLAKKMIGKSIDDKAFTSTTLSRDAADKFLGGGSGRVMMKIKVPKGKSGIYIENIAKFGDQNEYEFLLPRNAKFSIDSVEEIIINGKKTLNILATLI